MAGEDFKKFLSTSGREIAQTDLEKRRIKKEKRQEILGKMEKRGEEEFVDEIKKREAEKSVGVIPISVEVAPKQEAEGNDLNREIAETSEAELASKIKEAREAEEVESQSGAEGEPVRVQAGEASGAIPVSVETVPEPEAGEAVKEEERKWDDIIEKYENLAEEFDKSRGKETTLKNGEKIASVSSFEKYQNADAKEKALMLLSKNLEDAREEYLQADLKLEKDSGVLKFFGLKKKALGARNEEFEPFKQEYESALKEYKDAILEFEGLDMSTEDEEGNKKETDAETLLRHYQTMEYLNLENRKNELKIEQNPKYEKFKQVFVNTVETYKRAMGMPAKALKKFMGKYSGTIAGIGVTGSVLSSAMKLNPVTFGLIKTLSFASSSYGFKQMLEKRAAKKNLKEDEEMIGEHGEDISKAENAAEELRLILDEKIAAVDDRLIAERFGRIKRTQLAVFGGGLVSIGGHYAGRYIGNYISENEEVGEMVNKAKEGIGSFAGGIKDEFANLDLNPFNGEKEAPETPTAGEEITPELKAPEKIPGEIGFTEGEAGKYEAGEKIGFTEGEPFQVEKTPIDSVEIAEKGDSVWKMSEEQLEERGFFKGLTGTPDEIAAKKTYLIDAIKDEVVENPGKFGLKDVNSIQVGQRIDFSSIFENQDEINSILAKAKGLSAADIKDINNYSQLDQSIESKFKPGDISEIAASKLDGTPPESLPVSDSSIEAIPSEINGTEVEQGIIRGLELTDKEYASVKDWKVGRFMKEVESYGKFINSYEYYETDGGYEWSNYPKYQKLHDWILNQSNHEITNDMKLSEFLQDIDPNKISPVSDVNIEASAAASENPTVNEIAGSPRVSAEATTSEIESNSSNNPNQASRNSISDIAGSKIDANSENVSNDVVNREDLIQEAVKANKTSYNSLESWNRANREFLEIAKDPKAGKDIFEIAFTGEESISKELHLSSRRWSEVKGAVASDYLNSDHGRAYFKRTLIDKFGSVAEPYPNERMSNWVMRMSIEKYKLNLINSK